MTKHDVILIAFAAYALWVVVVLTLNGAWRA